MGFKKIAEWIDYNFIEIVIIGAIGGVIGGGIYLLTNANDYRGDKEVIQQINFGQYTARVVEEDRQFTENLYRLDVLDEGGHTIVKAHTISIPTFTFPSNPKSDSLEKRVEE